MPGMREALESAYDEIDAPADAVGAGDTSGDSGEVLADAPEPEESAAPVGDDRPRDESGRFVKTETKPAQGQPAAAPANPVTGQGAPAVPPPPVAAPAFKPPQSWKPALREKWGTLPAEVQAEVDRREKEIAKALQQRAEFEKGTQGWNETTRPYEALIRQSGLQPQQYVGDLLKTAHALAYSAPQQKAQLMAGLIMQFGITPQDLDAALVASMQGAAPQAHRQAQPQEFRDPRLDQFFAAQQQQAEQEAQEGASSFAETHEYFNDVAEDLANILDSWAAQGKKHVTDADMERAYRMACYGNEDVVQAIEGKKAASAAQTAQAATERARVAASSIRSQPTAAVAAQPAGRRSALEAAYDELDQR